MHFVPKKKLYIYYFKKRQNGLVTSWVVSNKLTTCDWLAELAFLFEYLNVNTICERIRRQRLSPRNTEENQKYRGLTIRLRPKRIWEQWLVRCNLYGLSVKGIIVWRKKKWRRRRRTFGWRVGGLHKRWLWVMTMRVQFMLLGWDECQGCSLSRFCFYGLYLIKSYYYLGWVWIVSFSRKIATFFFLHIF